MVCASRTMVCALPAGGGAAGRGGAAMLRGSDSGAGLCVSEPPAPRAGLASPADPARLHGVRKKPEC